LLNVQALLYGVLMIAEKRKFFTAMENLYLHLLTRFEKTIELPLKKDASLQKMEHSWDNFTDEINAQLRELVLISKTDKSNQLDQLGRISDQILNVIGVTAILIVFIL